MMTLNTQFPAGDARNINEFNEEIPEWARPYITELKERVTALEFIGVGMNLIATERIRQQHVLGYDRAHDAAHDSEALSGAGAWYALDPRTRARLDVLGLGIWPEGWVFRGNTSRIRELQKAGALIAAEIDRLIARGER